MFDIRGDSILFDGYTIGTLQPVQPIGIRIEAENMLLDLADPRECFSEDELEAAKKEAYNKGYAKGLRAGRKDA